MSSLAAGRSCRAVVAVAVAVVAGAGACTSPTPHGAAIAGLALDTTMALAPGSDTVFVTEAEHDSLVAVGRAQQYATRYGSGDRQRLMRGRYPLSAHGPLIAIQPSDSSVLATRDRLAAGLVVARWINREGMRYLKLGSVGRDTTYWFVDSIPGGPWRSRFVSSRYTGTIVEDTTLVIHPSGSTHAGPLARWVWLDADETGWVTCTSAGCCTSRSALMELTAFEGL